MRGIFFCFLCAIFFQAQAQNQSKELRISLYNDSWGGGFTPIYDDLRTYHFQAEYLKTNRFRLFTRYSLLTNRFDTDTLQRKSMNEWIMNGSLSIVQFNEGKGGNIWLKAGIVATGDILGSQIQKVTHQLFGVTQTDLPYYEEKKIHLIIGYAVDKSILTKPLREGRTFQWTLNHALDHHYNYMTTVRVGSPISLKVNRSQIIFTPEYTYAKSHLLNNDLLPKVAEAESGLSFGLKVFSKRIFYHFEIYPYQNFSYGGIGIRLYKENSVRTNPVKPLNLDIEVSLLSKGYGYNFKYSFMPFVILERRAKIIVNHHYHTFLKRYIPDSPIINGHGNQLTVGLQMTVLKAKSSGRIIDPYLNLSLGDKAISIYSKTANVARQTSHHVAINNDVGINIRIPYILNDSKNYLALSMYHRLIFLNSLTPAKESRFVDRNHSPYATTQHAFGVGIRFRI